jgi:hypothetical protein
MALGEWTLIRARHPGDTDRAYRPGLAVVPNVAVIPHFDTFGGPWAEGSLAGRPNEDAVLVGVDERSAALWQDGAWRAYGPGSITVFTGDARTRYEAGEAIEGIPQPMSDPPIAPQGT